MNLDKKGSNLVVGSIVDLVLFLLFFLPVFGFVTAQANGGAFYEDFYSKEIARIINGAEPGMEFKVDITPLAIAASKTGMSVEDTIFIDNIKNLVVVSSKYNSKTVFSFFNDVDITDFYVESVSGTSEKTRFIFKVRERQK